MKYAIIATVFNRKNVTIAGLNRLFHLISMSQYTFDVFVTDDNSNDGTSDAIMDLFPQVNIIHGDGSLFWGGGMNAAWKEANAHSEYDGYIWFNDDVLLYDDALNTLMSSVKETCNKCIIVGAFESSQNKTTYGGRYGDKGTLLDPNGKLQPLTHMNGNLVYIPRTVFDSVGYIDSCFRHSIGDFDYGLRANIAGFSLYLTGKYVGICERHDSNIPACYNPRKTLKERLKNINSPLGPDMKSRMVYIQRYRGMLHSYIFAVNVYAKVLFPNLYKYNRK